MKLGVAGRIDGCTRFEERWAKLESSYLVKDLQKVPGGQSLSAQESQRTDRFFGSVAVTAEERARYKLLGLWAAEVDHAAA